MLGALRRLSITRCANHFLRLRTTRPSSAGVTTCRCRFGARSGVFRKEHPAFLYSFGQGLSAVPLMDVPETEDSTSFLGGKEDKYGGFIIDESTLPNDESEFSRILGDSLKRWRETGKRGIWLKIPSDKARFVGPAVDTFQFVFHHAEEAYVMLVKWLPNEPHHLPPHATHQIGIGAYVVNDEGHVLAVQEKNGPLKGMGVWKLPTGLANIQEDVSDAAVREVLEETGVQTEFQAIIAIRQAHGYMFGKSDMFFLCALKAVGPNGELQKQESEIEALQWMPFDEFISQEFWGPRATFKKMLGRCQAFTKGEYKGLKGGRLQDGFRKRSDFIMWGPMDSDSDNEEVAEAISTNNGAKL